MDPDLPIPSIEDGRLPSAHERPSSTNNNSANSPQPSSSPYKESFKTPLSYPSTSSPVRLPGSPSRVRTTSNERHKAPVLQTRRSSSNLSVNHNATPQFRRTSSNLNPTNSVTTMKPVPSNRRDVTASTVARDYLQKELGYHTIVESEVAVLVHDSCYGHRFSRPRTTKAALSTIVERPERIHATLLGAATAYVRLGGRHAAGSHGPSPDRQVNTTSNPPFTLRKTSRFVPLSHAAVTQVHGTKWMEELQIMCDSAEGKLAANGKELTRPIGYGKDETGISLPKLHEGDLYLCSESLAALEGCLGGVCDAVDTVFQQDVTKRVFVCIRPPGHHCSSDYPSGFCWLNNVHVGVSYAAMTHGLTHAAIFDFDLHHGDGSQTITWNHNRNAQSLPKNTAAHKKIPIGYYSLHDINSYPCEWGDEEKVRNASLCLHDAHGQSIWNVHLDPWTSLDEFWKLYESKYVVLLEKARLFLRSHAERFRKAGVKPKGAIFISAGFDASQWEGAGMQRHNVNVPTEFYARFTRDTTKLAEEAGLGVDGRVISVLEGGYSDRALTSGVLSHLCGLVHGDDKVGTSVSDVSMSQDLLDKQHSAPDSSWWNETNLEMLESMVAGNVPQPSKKKDKQPGNYSSPTHASNARLTDQVRERRSLSVQLDSLIQLEATPTEPPPEVDWVTASYELSQLLIPSDRQTLSCRHDELNAEATRARRERQSIIGPSSSDGEPMQLRIRKAKNDDQQGVRASSRNVNRRTTIAAVSDLPDPASVSSTSNVRPRRRSSAASDILSGFKDMKIEANEGISSGNNFECRNPPNALLAPTIVKALVTKKTKSLITSRANSRTNSPLKGRSSSKTSNPVPSESRPAIEASNEDPWTMQSSSPQQGSATEPRNAMDGLTNGMKKVSIKLKLPTPEQHAVNQRKAEEDKERKVRAPRKPPVPKLVRTKPPAASKVVTQTSDRDIGHVRTQPEPLSSSQTASATLPLVNTPLGRGWKDASSTQSTLQQIHEPIHKAASTPNHEPATQGMLSTTTTPSPAQYDLTPFTISIPALLDEEATSMQETSSSTQSTRTPVSEALSPGIMSPKRTKADLPVFTPSSSIPFSRQDIVESLEQLDVGDERSSIWNQPATPHR